MFCSIRKYSATFVEQFGEGWNRFFYTPADIYPLAVLRILVGLAALFWQLSFYPDLIRWFGMEGMFLAESLRGEWASWSYLSYVASDKELWVAHLIGSAVLLAATVGLKTRLAVPAALIVVLSYIHRGPLLTGLAEPILTLLLFYLCFAPSGRCLSVDAWRARRKSGDVEFGSCDSPSIAANIALRLMQVHLTVVYLMMGLAKLSAGSETWWEGNAVWWLLARPETRMVDLTGLLYEHPYIINAWTHGIVLFEVLFALFIWNRLARPLLLALTLPMWFLMAILTGQTFFCLLMVFAGAAFVPADVLRSWFRETPRAAE